MAEAKKSKMYGGALRFTLKEEARVPSGEAYHPERIRQGCAKDLNVTVADEARSAHHPRLTRILAAWQHTLTNFQQLLR